MASLILSSNRTGIRLVDLKDFEISLFILYPPENYVDGSTLATFEEADTVDKTGPRKQLLNKLRIWFSSNFPDTRAKMKLSLTTEESPYWLLREAEIIKSVAKCRNNLPCYQIRMLSAAKINLFF